MHIDHWTGYWTGYDDTAAGVAAGGMLRRLWKGCAAWRLRRAERRCVAELDDRMRADIGLPCLVLHPRAICPDREG